MKSDAPFSAIGVRAHHIVLMHLNKVHTEYHTYQAGIFYSYDQAYIDKLLAAFVPKRKDIGELVQASGYDDAFIKSWTLGWNL